jgi:hypothetical protein
MSYCVRSDLKSIPEEATHMTLFYKGESVRHKKRAEWGIGKIIAVDKCGTIRVAFKGEKEKFIAKGSNYLTKVEEKGS